MRKENILRENYGSKVKPGKNGSNGSFRRSTLRFRRFAGRHIRWFGQGKVQRNVKDRLFRFLFDKDREALLQLYNALNGTEYQDASQLQVVTIESAVYVVMKNDLAFIPASNEPSGCLQPFGDCREGGIPRSLLRFQAMMPRRLLRGISLWRGL